MTEELFIPSAAAKPLVRIVDDDAKVRKSEAFVLSIEGWDIAAYETAEAFLEGDDPTRPGCIVLDVRMPGMSGLELQAELIRLGRTTPVLFLSGHGDIGMAVLALKRGASDFLQKPIIPEKLQAAVARLVRWHQQICRSLEERQRTLELVSALTPRELEVARLAAKGLSSREIAQVLGSAEQTVKQQRSTALHKLDARGPMELADIFRIADEPIDDRAPLGSIDEAAAGGGQ